ncbi:threonine aldolase [Aequitasia blattaphilus]|uniref:Uncharacterized protein n=1 Tax=Aequitasia blattaphilus TaxID=2949332 RepID=A0ABT1E943_9FIRM|nr:hypothetical protein [Aequitasia blattaphilus]MCP1102346.1 hypothetical protein [Aequitasia blattaphilus]MCR8614986.1 hypothetical protein [Aequitasia blattaphilus]
MIRNPLLQEDFRHILKQKGGLLAKGRLLGIQFLTLFTNNLYYKLGENALQMASHLTNGLEKLGIPLAIPSETNQIFVVRDMLPPLECYHSEVGASCSIFPME